MGRRVLVFVSGVDGSGKSTTASSLVAGLRKAGAPVVRVWFRHPYFFLLPLLLLFRLAGVTEVIRCRECGGYVSVHRFERFGTVYKLLFTIDFTIHYVFRVMLRAFVPVVLVVERGPLDSLVDLLTDVSDGPTALKGLLASYYAKLQGRGLTVLTRVEYPVAASRRPESRVDRKFRLRYLMSEAVFGTLARPALVVRTERPLRENLRLVAALILAIRSAYGWLGYGKLFRNPYLRGLFSSKWVILATNWLVQGAGIADIVENAVRVVTDVGAVVLAYLVSGDPLVTAASFVIVHTLNYLLNSNAAHVMRFFREVDPERNFQALMNYLKERTRLPSGVEAVVIFGSYVRGEEGTHSDIDVRVIRGAGIMGCLKSYVFLTRLRVFALIKGVPLDIFMHNVKRLCRVVSRGETGSMIVLPPERKSRLLAACGAVKG